MKGRDKRRRWRWMGRMVALRPRTPAELHRFVRVVFGLNVPRVAMSENGCAPFAYLVHVFFEGERSGPSLRSGPAYEGGGADCVVWANRGGGKTLLGAVATLLDLLFKPGVQVRILGGSLEQSSKMYAHLLALCDRPMVRPLLANAPTQRRVRLINGSGVEVLAQSQRSVRGVRVHKLRCDEVEEFQEEVWQAAQLVTRSDWCGDVYVHGSIEALSTMHKPGGLMGQLIEEGDGTRESDNESESEGDGAEESGSSLRSEPAFAGGRRVFRWNFLDVIERCPPSRPCEGCVLWHDCGGRAKYANGFMKVDDLVAQWHRSSREAWAAEMACRRPRRSDCVYPNFDMARHVSEDASGRAAHVIAGMDFGLRSPLVMLWAAVDATASASPEAQPVHVIDEYIEDGRTLEQHLHAIAQYDHAQPRWLGVDPAGKQRNSHSGLTDIDVLRAHGYTVRARSSRLADGIERLRRRLDRDTLRIHPRCTKLIEALRNYHFDHRRPACEDPVKDGPDHACDALRYMVLNLECGASSVTMARWA